MTSLSIEITTLNINGLNTPIKSQSYQNGFFKKSNIQLCAVCKYKRLFYIYIDRLIVNGRKRIHHKGFTKHKKD